MKNRLFVTLALMLCMSALFIPITAYAAAPTVTATLSGDVLHVETGSNQSGIEAVYVNGHRFNYFVDGAIDIPLRNYAGAEAYISVYAVDFAGNKSNTTQIPNPYYVAATPSPTPMPTPTPISSTPTPAPTQTPKPTEPPTTVPATPVPSTDPEPTATPEPSESAIGNGQQPFTPDGTGTVMDNVSQQNGKEFFTIITPNENTFYLVIDRQRDSENVYLLNAVTEEDLMALAEKGSGTTGESAIPTPVPAPVQPTPEPTPQPTPEPALPAKSGSDTGTIILIVVASLAVGAAGYYFKIVKPRRDGSDASENEDEMDADDMENETELEDIGDDADDGYSGDNAFLSETDITDEPDSDE